MSDDIVEVIAKRFRALGLPRADCVRGANEALAALEAAGYAVVPVEPTEKMVKAGQRERFFWNSWDDTKRALPVIYAAMLSASKAEGGGDDQGEEGQVASTRMP